MALTGKQSRFISEYLINPNGTQAAIKAGYSAKTARAIASENLKKPEIIAELRRQETATRKRLNATAQQVTDELMRLVQADMGDMFDKDGSLVPPHLWPRELWAVVKSVKHSPEPSVPGRGKKRRYRRLSIQMHDRLGALKLLAEHVGLIEPRRKTKPRTQRR